MAEPAGELNGLVGVAAEVMEALGEVGVGLLVAAENLFPPITSELILPLAGFLAAQGRLSLTLTIVAATVGSVVGAFLLFEPGRRLGLRRIRSIVVRLALMQGQDVDRADDRSSSRSRSTAPTSTSPSTRPSSCCSCSGCAGRPATAVENA
ncbi:hypothetical protein BH24ACT10_BH24ACT10_10720 [soil metagenome]